MKPGTTARPTFRYVEVFNLPEGLGQRHSRILELQKDERVLVLEMCLGVEWGSLVKAAKVLTRCGKVGCVQARYLSQL